MAKYRYVIIIPILTTILIFASTAGIIGNAFLLKNLNNNVSRTSYLDLNSNEVVSRSINIPSEIRDYELTISIDYLNSPNILSLDIYLMSARLSLGVNTLDDFINSTDFSNNLIDFSKGVHREEVFYLGSNPSYNNLYVIFANPANTSVSLQVTMLLKDTSGQSLAYTGHILGTIFSGLFTAIFFFLSIYLWMDYFGKVSPSILTKKLEKRLEELQDQAVSWELFLAGVSVLLLIIGYNEVLLGQGFGSIIGGAIAGIVVYYNYSKRQKLESQIRVVLISHGTLSLTDLAELVAETKENTKKVLLDAILYSDMPAEYDFKTETVRYAPEKDTMPKQVEMESKFEVASTEIQSQKIEETAADDTRPMPVCAYCDTEAISRNSQFCYACGASMSSAK